MSFLPILRLWELMETVNVGSHDGCIHQVKKTTNSIKQQEHQTTNKKTKQSTTTTKNLFKAKNKLN
jgi:hypothetical protein